MLRRSPLRYLAAIVLHVERGTLVGGDIAHCVVAVEFLLTRAQQTLSLGGSLSGATQTSRVDYADSAVTILGMAADGLLESSVARVWRQLNVSQRIDRAARLMTMLQNLLVLRSLTLQIGKEASVNFQNYRKPKNLIKHFCRQKYSVAEGQVKAHSRMPEPVPLGDAPKMTVNRLQISDEFKIVPPPESADTFNFSSPGCVADARMQVPNADVLSKQTIASVANAQTTRFFEAR